MNRIDSYEDLAEQIVNWIKDYYWDNDLGGLVVGCLLYTSPSPRDS